MSTTFQTCPGCESFILADTYECPECGHVFDQMRSQAAAVLTEELRNQSMYDICRKCGESVRSGLVRCWNCNTFMRKDVEAKYQQMQAMPQQIIFSDIPKDQRTELIQVRADGAYTTGIYDAQDDDEFEFTLRDGDTKSGEFELSPPQPTPVAPIAQSTAAPAATAPAAPAPAATAPAAPAPAATAPATPATPTPTATPAAKDSENAQPGDTAPKESVAEKPSIKPDRKSPDEFDADDLVGIALQDQRESRQRKKKKVEEGRSKRILMPCTRCGAWIRVHQDQGGRTLRCRQCKYPFVVPQMKKKEQSAKGTKQQKAAAQINVSWMDDIHIHLIAPTDIVLKPGSLEKGFEVVDAGCHESGLHLVRYAPPAKKSLFGKADGPPATDDQRKQIREHIASTGAIAALPFGDLFSVDVDGVGKIRLVQPVAEAHESMFAGVPVFGNGQIAIYLPLALEDNKQAFLSLPLSKYRMFSAQLKQRFGVELKAEQNGVPATDESETLKCHLSEQPIPSLKNLVYYENDPDYELEVSGFVCGTCGCAITEEARARQKLGGAAGKSIAKAKCPSCSNKFGDQKAYRILKSPGDAEEKEQEEGVSEGLKPQSAAMNTAEASTPVSAPESAAGGVTPTELQGAWKMISLGRNGKFDEPDDVSTAGIVFAIDGEKYSVTAGDQVQEQGTLVFNASENPAHFDQAITEGPDAGKSHLGIIRLVAGKLHNCQAAFGEPRPQSFDAQANSSATLAIFERG